jgi:hypothetical protein
MVSLNAVQSFGNAVRGRTNANVWADMLEWAIETRLFASVNVTKCMFYEILRIHITTVAVFYYKT